MKIPVLGMDPSMNNWGLAASQLCLETGYLDTPHLTTIRPVKPTTKQVRQNSLDLAQAEWLAEEAIAAAREAKVVFVECPVGSQSARAMASYGICVGVLGAIRALGIPLIEVTATESKLALTADKNATKRMMIETAAQLYPEANFPRTDGRIPDTAEHVADAIAAIHAGVLTPMFQNLIRIYEQV